MHLREREIFHLLVHSQTACGQGWAKPKPGDGSQEHLCVSPVGAWAQRQGPSSAPRNRCPNGMLASQAEVLTCYSTPALLSLFLKSKYNILV